MEATKKMTKRELFIQSFMAKNKDAVKTEYKDILIINHTDTKHFCIAIWEYKKSIKPSYYYAFRTDAERKEFEADRKHWADRREADDQRRMNEYTEKKKGFQVGSILYCSWGYEQTNIDWYIVLERKNDYILIQEIGTKKTYDNNYNDRGSCLPDATIRIGDPFKKKITKYASVELASYKYCTLWNGQSKSWSSYA